MEDTNKVQQVFELMVEEVGKGLRAKTGRSWDMSYLFDANTFSLTARTRMEDGQIYAASTTRDIEIIHPDRVPASTAVNVMITALYERFFHDTTRKEQR